MSILLQKGLPYSADYASNDFPVLDSNWSGEVSLYSQYPGVPVATYPMALVGNVLKLTISIEEILLLDAGVYAFVSKIINEVEQYSVSVLEYATVTPALTVTGQPMTAISMTIAKVDGTPAGKETKTLTSTVNGAVVTLGWDGVQVTASHSVADEVSGAIIGTETISTKTNAAGYAQLSVIKGQTVTVSCPSFGKSVIIDTTGLDAVDLSNSF